jgi:hypothetical protein
LNPEVVTVEERLSRSGNSSDLTVKAERRGDADMLIVAGWTPSVLGRRLMALHSEWDGAARPRVPTAAEIERIAATLPAQVAVEVVGRDGTRTKKMVPRLVVAKQQAEQWLNLERTRLYGRLKSFPAARDALVEWCTLKGIDHPRIKVEGILAWWLDHICPQCNGTKYEVAAGTNRQSNRACRPCGGSGEKPLPHGDDGRLIEAYMVECVGKARQQIRRFTQNHRSPCVEGQSI